MNTSQISTMPRAVVLEKSTVLENTLQWWRNAHEQHTPHHEQFPGYCHICRAQKANPS